MSHTPPKVKGAKNPRLKVTFTDEQKEAHALFHKYDVNFITGSFGSGKTLVASGISLLSFRKKMFDKIWITSPAMDNGLGYVPGDLDEKMEPWVFPILNNFNKCQAAGQTNKMREKKQIEIRPISLMQGVTLEGVTIVDEFQNMTIPEFKMTLTRLGKGSKIIFCGDLDQTRIPYEKSCASLVPELQNQDLVAWSELTSNHRNDSIPEILNCLGL